MAESSSLLDGLRHLVAALGRAQRRFAVVGGIAVAVRGEPRFTRDIDVAVATSGDRDMEGLVFALRGDGYEVDRTDAIGLLLVNASLDLEAVRANLRLIAERGFDRGEDLSAKLASVLEAASRP